MSEGPMKFGEIVGRTLESIEQFDERIVFNFADGTACESVHSQDCCESVSINRIEGDTDSILNQPILEADETFDSAIDPPEYPDSWTWTRQRIKTAGGEVTFVWLGESNGYYGETPYFRITHGRKV